MAIRNYWPAILYFKVSNLEGLESHEWTQIYVKNDESRMEPDLCEEYINKELNEELLPVLRHKFFVQNFCQGHEWLLCKTCFKFEYQKLAYSFYLTLDNIKMCCFNFHNFGFTAPLKGHAFSGHTLFTATMLTI